VADENIVDEVVDTKVVQPAGSEQVGADPAGSVVLTDAPREDKPVSAPADWPADWRERAAAGDEKKLSRLQRYASPQAIADALIAAQAKLSETRPVLGKDARPEEVAAYREALGIPASPDKYDLSGLELVDTEKPMIDKFLATAHAEHMTPSQVRQTLQSYGEISEEMRNQRLKLDEDIKSQAEDKLRSEWGNDYRVNLNLLTNLLDTAPSGVREQLLHGRLADGTPIGSSVEVLKFLTGIARERNPSGVTVPSGTTTTQGLQDELAKIEKTMRENRNEYNRDEQMQQRYRQLLEWKMAQEGRAA